MYIKLEGMSIMEMLSESTEDCPLDAAIGGSSTIYSYGEIT